MAAPELAIQQFRGKSRWLRASSGVDGHFARRL
jgi:hypothetical protein